MIGYDFRRKTLVTADIIKLSGIEHIRGAINECLPYKPRPQNISNKDFVVGLKNVRSE